MTIKISFVTVVIKKETIKNKYSGGMDAFLKKYYIDPVFQDQFILGASFMGTYDAEEFIDEMIKLGFSHLVNEKCVDLAIVDQFIGLFDPCPWLGTSIPATLNQEGKISTCWLSGCEAEGVIDTSKKYHAPRQKKIKETPETENLVSFIPEQLEIENLPELNVFPNKIVYMSFNNDENSKVLFGTSSYAPVLESLIQTKDHWELRYDNELNDNCWLRIIYYPDKKSYSGEKYILGELKVITDGSDWNSFFNHLTMVGLQDGEKCELTMRNL